MYFVSLLTVMLTALSQYLVNPLNVQTLLSSRHAYRLTHFNQVFSLWDMGKQFC